MGDDENATAREEEVEVLQSIYEGDPAFSALECGRRFQYKYGEDGSSRSFLLEVSWGDGYPGEEPAGVSLEAFYNKHLTDEVRDRICSAAQEEAVQNEGMPATYTVFEAVKERVEELLEGQPDEEQIKELAERLRAAEVDKGPSAPAQQSSAKEPKKEQLTKAQKRAAFKKTGTYGEDKPRGHDWIDVIRHLSQTGPAKQ